VGRKSTCPSSEKPGTVTHMLRHLTSILAPSRLRPLLLGATLLGTQSACITKFVISSQASATRSAGAVADGLGDLAVARVASMNGLATNEGMHYISPNNEDVLFLLLSGWTQYGYAFVQSDLASLEEGTDEFEDTKKRVSHAYERAIHYGLLLLGKNDEGFLEAKKNERSLSAWLTANFSSKEDAARLYWFANAWMARVGLRRDEPIMVGELWVGASVMERSMAIDPTYGDFGSLTGLGAYHARASVGELDEAKKLYELALAKTQRKNLLVHVGYATRYACVTHNRPLYDSLLQEALLFDETSDPTRRLTNTLAKQMARRAIKPKALKECDFDPAVKTVVRKTSGTGELSVEDLLGEDTPAVKPAPSASSSAPTTVAPAPSNTTPATPSSAPAPTTSAPGKPSDKTPPKTPAPGIKKFAWIE
jgi:TRAP transporter T-component